MSSHAAGTTIFFFRPPPPAFETPPPAFENGLDAGTTTGDTPSKGKNGGGGTKAAIAIVILLLLVGGFVFFRRFSKAKRLADANRIASIDELTAVDSPKPFEVTNQAFIGRDQDSTVALASLNDDGNTIAEAAAPVTVGSIVAPTPLAADGGALPLTEYDEASIMSPNKTNTNIAEAAAVANVGGIIAPIVVATVANDYESADTTPVGAAPPADADLYEAATTLPEAAAGAGAVANDDVSAADTTAVGAATPADADLYEAATVVPGVAAGPSVPSRNADTTFARNLARLVLDDDGGGGDHTNAEEAKFNATAEADSVVALESLSSPPVPGPPPVPAQAPVPAPRQVPREAPTPINATTTSPNLGVMQIYFHGAISRGEAEETLRATGANFRYLFRAKNSSSVVMSVRYTAEGKHKVQHSMMSQAVSAGSTTATTYLLDGKAFNAAGSNAPFEDALKELVSATAKRIGKQLYPVRDPNQADTANAAGSNAVGAYQNTSWEVMASFLSELPLMDRPDAEQMLEGKGVDGGFMLRRKAAQNVVITCMVSSGTFQHHAVTLAETLGGQSAAWIHRGKAVEEQSLIEAGKAILRDNHVQTPTWVGAGSGVFSSEA